MNIHNYISKNQLLAPNQRVLVALSGGADSVALLRILIQLGYSCEVAHCNFQLRGAESDRDQQFVESICESHHLTCHVTYFDTKEYARIHKISIEMAARTLRYNWFEEICTQQNITAIALAHHLEDQTETLFLNLIRGTGIRGLIGMRPKNGKLIRPFLETTRGEIESYLTKINQPYITDSSNFETDFLRNKLRLQTLPNLRAINPSLDQSLKRTATYLSEIEKLYLTELQEATSRVVTENSICIEALLKERIPQTILFETLKQWGFNSAQSEDVYQSLTTPESKVFYSSEAQLIKERTQLVLLKSMPTESESNLETTIEPNQSLVTHQSITLTFTQLGAIAIADLVKDATVAYFDSNRLIYPLTIRKWQHGDRFSPLGIQGTQLISDYFTNQKFTSLRKSKTFLLCNATGEILWIIGNRINHHFRVSDKSDSVLYVRCAQTE